MKYHLRVVLIAIAFNIAVMALWKMVAPMFRETPSAWANSNIHRMRGLRLLCDEFMTKEGRYPVNLMELVEFGYVDKSVVNCALTEYRGVTSFYFSHKDSPTDGVSPENYPIIESPYMKDGTNYFKFVNLKNGDSLVLSRHHHK